MKIDAKKTVDGGIEFEFPIPQEVELENILLRSKIDEGQMKLNAVAAKIEELEYRQQKQAEAAVPRRIMHLNEAKKRLHRTLRRH